MSTQHQQLSDRHQDHGALKHRLSALHGAHGLSEGEVPACTHQACRLYKLHICFLAQASACLWTMRAQHHAQHTTSDSSASIAEAV